MDKSQVATSEDEQGSIPPVNFADTNLKENIGKSEIPLQTEIWKGKLEVNVRTLCQLLHNQNYLR